MIARIEQIEWFKHCGEPLAMGTNLPMIPVTDWGQATLRYHDTYWQYAILEARNVLTRRLDAKFHNEHQKWNTVTKLAKAFLISNVRPRLIVVQQQQGLDKEFVDTVEWNLLAAMMHDAYYRCLPKTGFFMDVLALHEAGHFPCGWEGGIWPEGKLVVL